MRHRVPEVGDSASRAGGMVRLEFSLYTLMTSWAHHSGAHVVRAGISKKDYFCSVKRFPNIVKRTSQYSGEIINREVLLKSKKYVFSTLSL